MGYRRFATYNVVGGFTWVMSMTFLGYFLGKVLGAKQIERVVYLIIFLSVLPLFIGAIRHRMATKKAAAAAPPAPSPAKAPNLIENGVPEAEARPGDAN
jgi:membrane-associated protein